VGHAITKIEGMKDAIIKFGVCCAAGKQETPPDWLMCYI
jgi:hypothetical protein